MIFGVLAGHGSRECFCALLFRQFHVLVALFLVYQALGGLERLPFLVCCFSCS